MSTEAAVTVDEHFNLDASWSLDPQVAIRPERFGALLYHFGTRRLSFLKSRTLVQIVRSLDGERDARSACVAAGVTAAQFPAVVSALSKLAASSMIRQKG